MNNFSMSIVYSNLVKEHFSDDLAPIKHSTYINEIQRYNNTTTLIDVILSIISSTQTAEQANIYDFEGKMVGAGNFIGQLSVNLAERPWYEETLKKDGWKYLSILEKEELPLLLRQKNTDDQYITLTRVYKDGNYVKQGIVEILQDYDTVFAHLNDLKTGNNKLEIFVLNHAGELIYPYKSDQHLKEGAFYNRFIQQNELSPLETHDVKNPFDDTPQYITYNRSDYTDWTVIIAQSQTELFSYIYQLRKIFFVLLAFSFLFILFISYLVAKKVTLPLKKLHSSIRKMDIHHFTNNDFPQEDISKNSVNEIEILNLAFKRMNRKLSQSLNELLIAKTQELDAKFLAYQSQMNPHFLYNNLANISVMAEEGMNKQIVSLCSNLSALLRYISTDEPNGVPIRSEIDYTKKYVDCMKLRYEEHLTYSIDIPEEMNQVIIPKLTIQPIVENAMKHGFNMNPPWHISISGEMAENAWRITITDNGIGFDPSVIDQLYSFTHSSVEDMNNLQIDGMGLKNMYIRLYLLYREHTVFEIKNNRRGASVTIGGCLELKRSGGKKHGESTI